MRTSLSREQQPPVNGVPIIDLYPINQYAKEFYRLLSGKVLKAGETAFYFLNNDKEDRRTKFIPAIDEGPNLTNGFEKTMNEATQQGEYSEYNDKQCVKQVQYQ